MKIIDLHFLIEIISNLQHEKFRPNTLKHILEGEINWRGDAMGYHSIGEYTWKNNVEQKRY